MQPEKFLEHFSTHLKNTIARGISIAAKLESKRVTPLHLFIALSEEPGSLSSELLAKFNISRKILLPYLGDLASDESILNTTNEVKTATIPELDEASKQALEKAMIIAYEHTQNYVGTEHLLIGILDQNEPKINKILKDAGVDMEQLEEAIDAALHKTGDAQIADEIRVVAEEFGELESTKQTPAQTGKQPEKDSSAKKSAPRQPTALDVFTSDLTSKSFQETLDPVIGREDEITRLIRILARRTKNNPVLVGEPGVGKTALVEGLAKRIATGNVPDMLKRKKIRSLDLTLLLAGTMYRGEFEARLKQLIEEVVNRDDTILFIDEIHNIIGAGSNSGTMDAANILKPALARGLLHCIGATTLDEYQKHISSDPALERRFQAITVDEPNRDTALDMIRGIKKYYEKFHSVLIQDEAAEAAVDLSIRYVHDNFLPDKAIDLIDEAAAAVRVELPESPFAPKRHRLHVALEEAREQKAKTIGKDALKEVAHWKEKEQKITRQIAALDKKEKTISHKNAIVDKFMIAKILAHKLHLTPAEILRNDWEKLDKVATELKQEIVGQAAVIDEIIRSLRQAYFRFGNSKKPLASFLFTGPSGVGKTALTRALAKSLYHDEKALMKFDMTEFAEQHSVSKLLGSPAGYIGYKERNRFTDELKKRPHAVLVFDEYDKAHPDVQKLLFQILDEGELTDSQGKKIFFNHSIVILTTNVGAELYQSRGFGFTTAAKTNTESKAEEKMIDRETKKRIEGKLKEHFGASLMGRIGHVFLFRPLDIHDRTNIVLKLFGTIAEELKSKKQPTIVPDKTVIEKLVAMELNNDTGIRELERSVERLIQDAIVDAMQNARKKKSYILTHIDGVFRLQ